MRVRWIPTTIILGIAVALSLGALAIPMEHIVRYALGNLLGIVAVGVLIVTESVEVG